jgi:hypothetical protein
MSSYTGEELQKYFETYRRVVNIGLKGSEIIAEEHRAIVDLPELIDIGRSMPSDLRNETFSRCLSNLETALPIVERYRAQEDESDRIADEKGLTRFPHSFARFTGRIFANRSE